MSKEQDSIPRSKPIDIPKSKQPTYCKSTYNGFLAHLMGKENGYQKDNWKIRCGRKEDKQEKGIK